jgi:hypothetical protein
MVSCTAGHGRTCARGWTQPVAEGDTASADLDPRCGPPATTVQLAGVGCRRHRVDVRREDLFRRAGLEVFSVVAEDLDDVPLVVDRMHAAVARARQSGVARTWRVKRDPGPP